MAVPCSSALGHGDCCDGVEGPVGVRSRLLHPKFFFKLNDNNPVIL